MQISAEDNIVTIYGNIKTISDYRSIKETVDAIVSQTRSVTLVIPDSLSMTSSVIGYLNKLAQGDGVKVTLKVGNAELMELLNELDLQSIFHIVKI